MGFSSIGGKFKGSFFGGSSSNGQNTDANSATSTDSKGGRLKNTESLIGNQISSGSATAGASKTESKAKPQTLKISKVLA
jgi:hypothetical protein